MASLLLLQLSLLGSGTLCALRGDRAMGRGTGHHAMVAPAQVSRAAGMVSSMPQTTGNPGMPHGCGMDGSCRAPWANGSCGAMGSCTVAVSAPSGTATSATTLSAAAELPELIRTVSDLTIAPEAPPPRA